jgi:hypothetical protein
MNLGVVPAHRGIPSFKIHISANLKSDSTMLGLLHKLNMIFRFAEQILSASFVTTAFFRFDHTMCSAASIRIFDRRLGEMPWTKVM